ncbi:sugar ABC transporter ATP-binding protein [Lactiplantibacillus pentosus]|uniref:Multiple sugar ABC transporter, ATP-binding protein n=1 Tax=Lactiplantibacillus pentosus IG1 TaxID=1042160 RepID=G0M421_LACPE|nr:sn-glycerol-3-phosphate ABC transporter ATP-binding protein UgpC [Lactiplantibacillus pentosus]CCC16910.1 multiple sugar ABC transporter, ATP-binding protein [Lactiplantibacillus pentosus IG1]MCT3301590.1 sn-glycerol-3-phosphate ABC transporter ATP-binding protein UgpC [Lactiplantibacillus pentosus]PRO80144.1 sugar ABC transporter ATP-binding protein [Lactiplantibacillus pentosus]PRO82908.1 sugar ABC transporter ATP-binding protein [Lactiplantibacillus pentosus]PRO92811.1 sugar ABC transpor
MAEIKLEHIYKRYPGNDEDSVTDFNLDIKDNEFIVFVGPSGCGKSTTLRMIAGLEDITKGDLKIDGEVMNKVHPKDRNIAMVFQNYALYPQMTVFDNMAFGLKIRKMPKDEIKKRVDNAAQILGLTDYLSRKPGALSGGQRQRVALGRAIVRDAKLFLLDEPLSNLDAKLRVQMRTQIAQLHQRLKTNMIYVTHDQVEAMTMADRIVIMNDGKVQQVGTPDDLYNRPTNKFVAGFMGSPSMNFFDAELKNGRVSNGRGLDVVVPEGRLKVLREQGYDGKKLIVGIRPEDIHTEQVALEAMADAKVEATVEVSEFLGTDSMLYSRTGDTEFVAQVNARDYHKPGEEVDMAFEMSKAHFFDVETELTIE